MLEQWTVWILGILKHAGDFQNKCLHCSLYLFYRVTFNTWLILQKFQLLLIVTYRRNFVLSSFDMFVHEQDIIAMLQEYIFSAYQFQSICAGVYIVQESYGLLLWCFIDLFGEDGDLHSLQLELVKWSPANEYSKIPPCVFHGRKQAFR